MTSVRRSDPGLKWLVAGGVVTIGILSLLMAFLADTIAKIGPNGGGAVGFLGFMVGGAAAAVALGPIGRAVGTRILGGGAGTDPAVEAEIDALRFQVEDLRQALSETHERLDFTERLLASSTEKRT
ncbi:MAG: hypothetical protein ACREL4_01295 [Gemmatimonadales bacterium]